MPESLGYVAFLCIEEPDINYRFYPRSKYCIYIFIYCILENNDTVELCSFN